MPLKKILIVVTTYPLPSRSYDELVCTAGVLEDGSWIRIYPIPLKLLSDLKGSGKVAIVKYTWIELELNKRPDDFRPESHSPKHYDFRDLKIHNRIGTESNWFTRKEFCLKKVYTDFSVLIDESKAPTNVSLATFKPSAITGFEWEEDDRDWKDVWVAMRKQGNLFIENDNAIQRMIHKVPYKFFYKFKDANDKQSRLMIEDWEIGQLYWNCLRSENNNEQAALQKVKAKYFTEFVETKDIYFFLGTTKEWHTRRSKNPFVIIGVFYPKKELQTSLFWRYLSPFISLLSSHITLP